MKRKIVLLSYIFLAISFFFLPLKTSISNFGIIGLLTLTILSFIINGHKSIKGLLHSFFFKSSFILAFPICFGLIYAIDFKEGLDEIIKALFLILLPLVIFRKDLHNSISINIMSNSLILGSLFTSFVLLSINVYEFTISDLKLIKIFSSHFTGFRFLEPLNHKLHPIYVGSYLNLAIIFMLFNKTKLRLGIKMLAIIILLSAIIFLNSRIILFSTLISFIIYSIYHLRSKVILISSIFVAILSIIAYPNLKKTYIYNKAINGTVWELQNNIGTQNTDTKTTSDSRMSRWISGWEAFLEQPILGYGSGSEILVLSKKYKENNMFRSLSQAYNSHNQFLSYLIKFGIVGTTLLMIFFVYNIFISAREKDLCQFSFFSMIFLVFLIENYLDRNMGVNLVALVVTVFLIQKND